MEIGLSKWLTLEEECREEDRLLKYVEGFHSLCGPNTRTNCVLLSKTRKLCTQIKQIDIVTVLRLLTQFTKGKAE